MTFFESIKTVFSKYADFSGRATRPEFWWFTLFSTIVSWALGSLNITTSLNAFSDNPTTTSFMLGSSLAGLWGVAVLVPSLAVGVRRLRDAGYRWTQLWWILLPIAGAIVLIIRFTQPSIAAASSSEAAKPMAEVAPNK